ncbi:hypothetical protein PC123_g8787 [Phytophthora cactorum]|nr:hypothetical protein PC123_g8787 [Phytophthora cactorum]
MICAVLLDEDPHRVEVDDKVVERVSLPQTRKAVERGSPLKNKRAVEHGLPQSELTVEHGVSPNKPVVGQGLPRGSGPVEHGLSCLEEGDPSLSHAESSFSSASLRRKM